MQAPHMPAPQPNFVPVSFTCSRMTQSSGVAAGASTVTGAPFTLNVTAIAVLPLDHARPPRAGVASDLQTIKSATGGTGWNAAFFTPGNIPKADPCAIPARCPGSLSLFHELG